MSMQCWISWLIGISRWRTSADARLNDRMLYPESPPTEGGVIMLAYVILNEMLSVGLRRTRMAEATCQSIRLKLLKIGAHVRVSVRRVVFSMASGYPDQDLFRSVLDNLQRAYHLNC